MTAIAAERRSRVPTVVKLGLAALAAVLLLTLPMWAGEYNLRLATNVALWVGLALSWNVICGYVGYVSFGHIAFYGLGAYTTAILMVDHGWSFFATLPVAAAVAAIVAVIVGIPTLRLRGAYFAIASWALAEALRESTLLAGFTGGSNGITLPIRSDDRFFYYCMFGATALAYLICWLLLDRSRFGFRVKAIRDNEPAARAQGIDTTRVKIEAFALSAAIPAVLGGINAYWITFINPASVLDTLLTDQLVVMVLVGGLGHMWGPAIGATALYLLQNQFQATYGDSTAYIIVVGVLLLLVVLFLPDGLASLLPGSKRSGVLRRWISSIQPKKAEP